MQLKLHNFVYYRTLYRISCRMFVAAEETVSYVLRCIWIGSNKYAYSL